MFRKGLLIAFHRCCGAEELSSIMWIKAENEGFAQFASTSQRKGQNTIKLDQ